MTDKYLPREMKLWMTHSSPTHYLPFPLLHSPWAQHRGPLASTQLSPPFSPTLPITLGTKLKPAIELLHYIWRYMSPWPGHPVERPYTIFYGRQSRNYDILNLLCRTLLPILPIQRKKDSIPVSKCSTHLILLSLDATGLDCWLAAFLVLQASPSQQA